MLKSVRRDKHGSDIRARKMADDVKPSELLPELFIAPYRHNKQQPEIIAAVHGSRHRIDVQFLAESETVALERNLVGIHLDTETGITVKPQDGIRQTP